MADALTIQALKALRDQANMDAYTLANKLKVQEPQGRAHAEHNQKLDQLLEAARLAGRCDERLSALDKGPEGC